MNDVKAKLTPPEARCDVDIEAGGGYSGQRGNIADWRAVRARTILLSVKEAVKMYQLP